MAIKQPDDKSHFILPDLGEGVHEVDLVARSQTAAALDGLDADPGERRLAVRPHLLLPPRQDVGASGLDEGGRLRP